jgi:hypothetical protein
MKALDKQASAEAYNLEYLGFVERDVFTHTSFIENSIEAGNLLCGNDALYAMLGARTRARMQLALVTMMFTGLIARLLDLATLQSC